LVIGSPRCGLAVCIPWQLKHLKNVFSNAAIEKDVITKAEFCSVAEKCPTLTFPAFMMLDTVKASALAMKKKKETKINFQKDYEKASEAKKKGEFDMLDDDDFDFLNDGDQYDRNKTLKDQMANQKKLETDRRNIGNDGSEVKKARGLKIVKAFGNAARELGGTNTSKRPAKVSAKDKAKQNLRKR
jgi:hypothetical protein